MNLVQEFERKNKLDYKENTMINYKINMREFLEFAKEHLKLEGTNDIEVIQKADWGCCIEFRNHLHSLGLAETSINRKLSAMRTLFKFSMNMNLIKENPREKVGNLSTQHIIQQTDFLTEEELSSYRFTVQYMYDRKLTDEVIEKYDIGFDPNFVLPGRKKATPCITMPVHDKDGNVLFFCRRAIDVKIYNYPENVVKPVYGIYQLPKGCKSVIICESIINALTAVVYGYCAVALMGTGNAYQIDQLKRLGVQEFVLCMDPDDAGRRGAKKLKNALKSVALVWNISLPDGKDLNDLENKAEFDYYYSMKE